MNWCSIRSTSEKLQNPLRGSLHTSRGLPHQRGLTSGEGRPFHPLIIRNIRDDYQLRSRQQRLRDAGMLTLTEIAAQLGVSAGTIKIWHHAGLLTAHPYNDK